MTTFSIIALLIDLVIAHVPRLVALKKIVEKDGRFEIRHPREQQAAAVGWAKRALAAHYNGLENYPIFASAVIVANLKQVSVSWLTTWLVVYLVCRVLYVLVYIFDLPKLRSLFWGVAFASCVALFSLALY